MISLPSFHRHGAKRSDAAKLAATIPAREHPLIASTLAGPLVTEASLASFECTRPNQGQSSSCTATSTGAGTFAAFAAIGQPGILPSFRYLYAASGLLEGSPLQDDGRQLADVMTVLQKGFAFFEGMSPDGRFHDIWTANDTTAKPPNVNIPPTGTERLLATTMTTGQHTIDPTSATASDEAVAVLSAPTAPAPLIVASYVGNAYENAGPDTVVDVEDVIEGVGGNHAMVISGFRTVNGVRQFRNTGSWGPDWADNGRCWVTEAWLLHCFEVWALTLSLSPART